MAALQPALTATDVTAVLRCLHTALSPEQGANKHAEAVLASLEHRPGFCSCLAEIIGGRAVHDYSARWLASSYLKNTIVRNWRSRAERSGLTAEERAHLRAVMMGLIDQEDNQIAIQVALAVAKMARVDYPQEWPSLFHDLLAQLSPDMQQQQQQQQNLARARRVYLVLHNLLKELSSKRLPADQRNFHEVSLLLLPFLWSQWGSTTQVLLAGLPAALGDGSIPPPSPPSPQSPLVLQQQQQQQDSPLPPPKPAPAAGLLPSMECWMLLLKCLRRILLLGFGSDAKQSGRPTQQVAACLPAMAQTLQQLLAAREEATSPHARVPSTSTNPLAAARRNQLLVMLDRGMLKLAKAHTQLQEAHPWAAHTSGALIPMLHLLCSLIMSHSSQGAGAAVAANARDRLLIQAMTYVHNVLSCQPYRKPPPTPPDPAPDQPGGGEAFSAAQAHAAMVLDVQNGLRATWGPERLQGLCMALVCGYMKLTKRDLQEWDTESEEFYHAHSTVSWQDHPKLCAETLYLVLLRDHKEVLAPLVATLLQQAHAACPAQPPHPHHQEPASSSTSMAATCPQEALAKEAVLNAVAVSPYELHDVIPFTPWLRAHLLPELIQGGIAARPLRRCAARVIEKWVSELDVNDRPAVYRVLLQIMAEPDACMKLTAASALIALVDDWNFSEAQFSDFVGPLLQLVTSALPDLHEMDSHTHMFHLLNLVVERMGESIKPQVPPLLQVLPQQWVAAEGQSHVRIQIISLLQRLVNVLGAECASTYPILAPLLPVVLDPDQPDASMLLEDGLGLWLVALRNAPAPVPPFMLHQLFPHLAHLLMSSTEHFHMGTTLVSSCILAGGKDFLAACGAELAALLNSLMGNVSPRGLLLLLPPFGLTLLVSQGGPPLELLTPALHSTITSVIEGGGQGEELSTAASCSILARLLLHSPQAFMSILASAPVNPGAVHAIVAPVQASTSAAAAHQPGPLPPVLSGAEAVLGALCHAWSERFDAIGHPAHRRLNALALCALLTLPATAPLWWLDAILGCVTGVVASATPDAPGTAVAGTDITPELVRGNGPDPEAEGVFVDLPIAGSEDAEAESIRRQQLSESDPAVRASVAGALRHGLAAAEALHGPVFQAAMARMDPTLQSQVVAAMGGV